MLEPKPRGAAGFYAPVSKESDIRGSSAPAHAEAQRYGGPEWIVESTHSNSGRKLMKGLRRAPLRSVPEPSMAGAMRRPSMLKMSAWRPTIGSCRGTTDADYRSGRW
jgi:hypothetical protein